MQSILDAINEWIKEILIGAINGNLSTMFGDVNEKVGTIAAEVGQTPQGWNAGIFSMIQGLSENVIVPIAGLVITYVLCVELISMVTEKNNMHDIDTFMFFKWFFKAWVAVYLVTHTFTITMAVFDMAQHVVSGAAGVIGGNTNIDVDAALSSMQAGLDAMEIPELLLLVMETSLVSLCMKIMSVLITVVDDIDGDAAEDKQFIVVKSKGGNYFYIIVDRAAEGENSVHFLNQVDESDLMAIIGEEQTEQPPAVCNCTEKCKAGEVNTACPVCSVNMDSCTGKEAAPEEPTGQEQPQNGMGGLLIFLVVGLLGGGAALYYVKFMKPKQNVKGSTDLDEFDFDEYDEDEPEEETDIADTEQEDEEE